MTVYKVRPDAESYGHDIGILLIDCHTPFIPGDVGNASTYGYPVLYRMMHGVTVDRLINKADLSMEKIVTDAAKTLEKSGVQAITGDCGYLLYFQEAVAKSVSIPVMLSSLLQLPLIASSLAPDQAIGILCANEKRFPVDLAKSLLKGCHREIHIKGLQDGKHFHDAMLGETGVLDDAAIENEVVSAATKLQKEHGHIGALLLECSDLPPYAHAVQASTGLCVFDFVTMINYLQSSTRHSPYTGNY